jgi:hypothetical protein
MSAAHFPATAVLSGNEEHLSVSPSLSALPGRRPIKINSASGVLFALPVKSLDDRRRREFGAPCGPNAELIETRQQARALLACGA